MNITKEQLKNEIETRFPSRRAFVSSFNEAAGFEALHETTLSRQLSGSLGITNFAGAAYALFFSLHGSADVSGSLPLTEIISETIDETYETISSYVIEWFDSSYDEKMKDIADLKKELIEKYVGNDR